MQLFSAHADVPTVKCRHSMDDDEQPHQSQSKVFTCMRMLQSRLQGRGGWDERQRASLYCRTISLGHRTQKDPASGMILFSASFACCERNALLPPQAWAI